MIKFGTGGWRAIIADGFTKENIRLPWLCDKFRRMTAPVLTQEGQDKLLALITDSEDVPIRTIVDTVNQYMK